MTRTVQIVANPAAGQDSLNLKELNTLFRNAGVDWDLVLTKDTGDAYRLARAAVAAGVDVVAAYGGDGTVAEVAGALMDTGVPLGILPGGTANVMSVELGIPSYLVDACALLCGETLTTRQVDAGKVDGRFFLLRIGIGFEAKMIEGADRTLKDRMGNLAYILSALKALGQSESVRYRLTLDGTVVEEDGIACVIANSGSLGLAGVKLTSTIDISDGLLDVVLVNNKNLVTVVDLVGRILRGDQVEMPDAATPVTERTIRHWQARSIRVETEPADSVQADGELIGVTPKDVEIVPSAVQIIVPAIVAQAAPMQATAS
jgi:YegS/Rv2252/BmrU family lipid kinase